MDEMSLKELPRRLRKPKVGENEAIRTGGGCHKGPRRQQNNLFKQIEDELEIREELLKVSAENFKRR